MLHVGTTYALMAAPTSVHACMEQGRRVQIEPEAHMGDYRVSWKPTKSGDIHLHVRINNAEILGSPMGWAGLG